MTVENEQLMGKLLNVERMVVQILSLMRDMHGMAEASQEPPISYATAHQKRLIATLRNDLAMSPMSVVWYDDLRAVDAVREIERLNSYLDEKVKA